MVVTSAVEGDEALSDDRKFRAALMNEAMSMLSSLQESMAHHLTKQEDIVRSFTEKIARLEECRGNDEQPPCSDLAGPCDDTSFVKEISQQSHGKDGDEGYVRPVMQKMTTRTIVDMETSTSRSPLRWVVHLWHELGQIKEPPRTGRLCSLIQNWHFEALTVCVIFLNGGLMIYTTDLAARELTSSSSTSILAVESAFVVYYLLEMLLRIYVHRLFFFMFSSDMWWNLFDLVVIGVSVFDISVTLGSSGSSGSSSVSFLRICRVFRIGKSLRILRALHFVRELRLLMDCIIGSVSSLVWCMLLLVLVTGIFSLFIVQNVTVYLCDLKAAGSLRDSEAEVLVMHFGSVMESMLSLIKSTTGGMDWGDLYDIIGASGPTNQLIYVLYVFFSFIAAWNIITSVFMEKALKLASAGDLQSQMIDKMRQDREDVEDLKDVARRADVDESGRITLTKFLELVELPNFRAFFDFKGLDIKDPAKLFKAIVAEAQTDDMDVDTFVAACVGLRGAASSVEMHNLSRDLLALSGFVREEMPKMRVFMAKSTRGDELHDSSVLEGAPPAAESISRDINSIADVMLKVISSPEAGLPSTSLEVPSGDV